MALDKEKTLESLRPYFQRGMSITKACEASGVCDDQTIFNWQREDPEISRRITAWQNTVSSKARSLLAEAITTEDATKNPLTKRERIRLAKWWLRHKERKEFSTRQEVESSGGLQLTAKGQEVDTLLHGLRNKQKGK